MHSCEGVTDKKWGEVLTDQAVIKRLKECLRIDVFRIKYLSSFRVSVGSSSVSLTFISHFFHNPQFFRTSRHLPSLSKRKRMMLKPPKKARVEKFWKLMLNIQREYDDAFLIRTKPSLSNLEMQLEFPLEGLSSKEVKIEGILVRNIIEYLRKFWRKVLNHSSLLQDGYDFRWIP